MNKNPTGNINKLENLKLKYFWQELVLLPHHSCFRIFVSLVIGTVPTSVIVVVNWYYLLRSN